MAFAGHLGVSLNVDLLVTEGDGIADSRAEYGDSKNWAQQVERAARRADAARALQRGARRRRSRCRRARRDEAMRDAARRRPGQATATSSARPTTRGVVEVWRDAKAVFSAPLRDLHQAWDEVELAHLPPARQPRSAPMPSTPPPAATTTPGCTSISPAPRSTRATRRAGDRRPRAQGRGAARAGRQQPRRAELRDEPGRLRDLRRPHDRPAVGPHAARHVPGLRRLRRLQLRRHARRRRRLGALDPLQRPARRPVRDLLRARRRVRARHLQRLPDDGRAGRHDPRRRRPGRASRATAASSSRRG